MGRDIAAFLTGLIVIAVIFTLVRPGSQGPAFVKALGSAIANLLSAAGTGGAMNATSSTGTGGAKTAGTTTGQGSATAGGTA